MRTQEITPELASALAAKLNSTYPHHTLTMQEIQADPPGANTVGLLSRFPIETMARFNLPGQQNRIDPETKQECEIPGSRNGLRVQINISDNRSINIQMGGFTVAAGQRFDYIWRSGDFTTIDAWVVDEINISDHFPVVAKLSLPQQE